MINVRLSRKQNHPPHGRRLRVITGALNISLVLALAVLVYRNPSIISFISPPPVSADTQVLKLGPTNATLTLPGTSAWLNNGNLGIGTTNPANKLDVAGGIDATLLNTGQGDYELYAMNQNVQTSNSPTFAGLTINGSIAVTGNVDGYDISAKGVNWDAAFTHVSANGSSHSYINQNVTTTGTPTFAAMTVNGNITTTGTVDGYDISAKGVNWDAAYAHISANGSSHSFINQSVTTTSSPTFATPTITGSLYMSNASPIIYSNTNLYLDLDNDNNGTQYLYIRDGANTNIATISEAGDISAVGQFYGGAADTAANPGYSWTGDTAVGMYRPTTNTIGLTTASTERMRIDAAGNVGFGTTTTNEDINIYKGNSSTIRFYSSYSPPADASNYGYIQQRGTTMLLGVGAYINEAGSNIFDSPSKFQGTFTINDNWTHIFSWSGKNPSTGVRSELMYLNYIGQLAVPVGLGTGTVYSSAGILQNTNPSSRDYKKDIQPIDLEADRILKLQPKSFVWKADGKHDVGYIAEEVRDVVPELWQVDPISGTKGYDVAKLPFYIIEVLKGQQKQIKAFADTVSTTTLKAKTFILDGVDVGKKLIELTDRMDKQEEHIEAQDRIISVQQAEIDTLKAEIQKLKGQ